MKKIEEFEVYKGKLADYIEKMEALYNYYLEAIEFYNNQPTDYVAELGDSFDLVTAINFIKSWKTIQEMQPVQRNMLLCYVCCDCDYKKTLEVFNGEGKNYKNVASLRVLVHNARKEFFKLYENID